MIAPSLHIFPLPTNFSEAVLFFRYLDKGTRFVCTNLYFVNVCCSVCNMQNQKYRFTDLVALKYYCIHCNIRFIMGDTQSPSAMQNNIQKEHFFDI